MDDIERRRVVQSIGAAGAALLAGCSSGGGDGDSGNETPGGNATEPPASDETGDGSDADDPSGGSNAGIDGDATWPTDRAGPGWTQAVDRPVISTDVSRTWSLEAGGSEELVVGPETVFGSNSEDGVFAVDPQGNRLWQHEADEGVAPKALAVTDEFLGYKGHGEYVVLEKDGGAVARRIEFESDSWMRPVVADGRVFHSSDPDGSASRLTAHSLETGERLWQTTGRVWNDGIVAGDTLYVSSGGDDRPLDAYDVESGALRWNYTEKEMRVVAADEAGLYGAGHSDEQGTMLYGHAPDEPRRTWETVAAWPEEYTSTFGLDDERLYLHQGTGMSAYDRTTGEQLWTYPVDGIVGEDFVVGDGVVLVPQTPGLDVLDPASGERRRRIEPATVRGEKSGDLYSAEFAAAHGRLYALTDGYESQLVALDGSVA